MQQSSNKIRVTHFQRKPRPGFNFSIESIFEDLRNYLKDKVDFSVEVSSNFNDGYLSKLLNITEATFRKKKNAIAHITGEVHFLNLLMHKKNVLLTIHDCRFMERKHGMSKLFVQYLYLKGPVAKSTYITTVSGNTKNDIIKYTNCNAEKIIIIPVALKKIYKPSPKQFNVQMPIILQIGTASNKNLNRLAEALEDIPCVLSIIGKLSSEQVSKLNKHKIKYTNAFNLSDEEMFGQYKSCDMLAFVSTSEGFGMPIAEANCVERPVLTSNISSMPEVANNAACFADPFDVNSIRNGVMKIIEDAVYREQLIANGRANCKRYNGEIIADAYYQLYKKITSAS